METMKELIEKLYEIVLEKLRNRDFTITKLKSSTNGYVDCSFEIEGYLFRAAFNERNFICWHEYPTFKEPELSEEETASICKYFHNECRKIRKEELTEEINKLQTELESL